MSPSDSEKRKPDRKRKIIALILFPSIILLGSAAIYFYLQYKRTHISTEDAYVDGYIHTIAPKIFGTVKALHITDNQLVRAGDLLLEIEPQDYVAAVRQARAALLGTFGASFFSEFFRGQGAVPCSPFHRPFFLKRFRPSSMESPWRSSALESCSVPSSAL